MSLISQIEKHQPVEVDIHDTENLDYSQAVELTGTRSFSTRQTPLFYARLQFISEVSCLSKGEIVHEALADAVANVFGYFKESHHPQLQERLTELSIAAMNEAIDGESE